MFEYSEFNVTATDGLNLQGRRWLPTNREPKAAVCLVHGFAEYSGSYKFIGETLANNGYALIGVDQRGHGDSGGQRGYTPSYLQQTMADVDVLLHEGQSIVPNRPLFIYGHSLGGGVVFNHVLRFPNPTISGIICTSPLLKAAKPPSPSQMVMLRILSLVAPRLSMVRYKPENEPKSASDCALTRDFQRELTLRRDPKRNTQMAYSLIYASLTNGLWALEHAGNIDKPLLLMHGSADRVVLSQTTESFAAKVAPELITLKIWQDALHELHQEINRQEVVLFMINWLDQITAAS